MSVYEKGKEEKNQLIDIWSSDLSDGELCSSRVRRRSAQVFPEGEAGIRKTTTALWIDFFPSPSLLVSPHPSVPCSPWTTDSMPAQKCGVTFKLCRSDSCSSVGWLHAARHVSGPPRLRWANDATPDSPLSFWACVCEPRRDIVSRDPPSD